MQGFRKRFMDNLKNKWYKQNFIMILVCLFAISSLSIGYSAILQDLSIQANILLQADSEIRITNIESNPSASCGHDLFNPRHDLKSITVNLSLPNIGCTMEYTVTIRNNTTLDMELVELVNNTYNNNDIVYEIDRDRIVVNSGETTTITFIFRYENGIANPTNTDLGAVIMFMWQEVFPDVITNLNAILIKDTFLNNDEVDIKNFLIVTLMVNGEFTLLSYAEYDVEGFTTNGVITNAVLTVSYRNLEATSTYSVIPRTGEEVGGVSQVSISHGPILGNQIEIVITTPGQIQTFWYFFSENLEDMLMDRSLMLPRHTGGGSGFNRIINGPLNEQGYLRPGYYYVYAMRNGNNHDSFLIIKVE